MKPYRPKILSREAINGRGVAWLAEHGSALYLKTAAWLIERRLSAADLQPGEVDGLRDAKYRLLEAAKVAAPGVARKPETS